MAVSKRAMSDNLRTIASYEGYASTYNDIVARVPAPEDQNALRRLAAEAGRDGTILEVGSGPGWDADFIETLGVSVRRTDATQAFLDLQRARGKQCERLNVISDPLGGPYDGIMALCVIIHVSRSATDVVLENIFEALRPGGAFLVSLRHGEGETRGDYLTTYWSRNGFASRLEQTGFSIAWEQVRVNRDGDRWLTFLARTPA